MSGNTATDQINRIEAYGERGLSGYLAGEDGPGSGNQMHGAMADFRDIMEDAWQRAAAEEER
jgi:hypothetical protein